MTRIVGIDLPNNKIIAISLTYIYGIGLKLSKRILNKLNIDENIRTEKLNEEQLSNIRIELSKLSIEGFLRRKKALDIKRLTEIRCYRGLCHLKGLPVRGQKTRNNAKTAKKNRKKLSSINKDKKNTKDMKKGF